MSGPSTPEEAIHAAIADHIRRVAQARETACEIALQSGGYGVLEIPEDDRWKDTLPSSSVPFGTILVASPRQVENAGIRVDC